MARERGPIFEKEPKKERGARRSIEHMPETGWELVEEWRNADIVYFDRSGKKAEKYTQDISESGFINIAVKDKDKEIKVFPHHTLRYEKNVSIETKRGTVTKMMVNITREGAVYMIGFEWIGNHRQISEYYFDDECNVVGFYDGFHNLPKPKNTHGNITPEMAKQFQGLIEIFPDSEGYFRNTASKLS